MQNVVDTILAQYGNSPILLALIDALNSGLDPQAAIDAIYAQYVDPDTAFGVGLDYLGKKVDIGRQLLVPTQQQTLGFSEAADPDMQPFDQSPFYNGPISGTFTLSDDAYRTLIFVKALANISDSSIPSYNRLLQILFAGRGRAYTIDEGAMQIRFVFEFYLMPYELAIMTASKALPRPSGVLSSLLQVDAPATLGFAEASNFSTFGNGAFSSDVIPITN